MPENVEGSLFDPNAWCICTNITCARILNIYIESETYPIVQQFQLLGHDLSHHIHTWTLRLLGKHFNLNCLAVLLIWQHIYLHPHPLVPKWVIT